MESMPQENAMREAMSRPVGNADCEGSLPGFMPVAAANDMRMSQLARTIEREIIPRLMLAHRTLPPTAPSRNPGNHHISAEDVKQFAKLAMSRDEDAAFAAVQTWRAQDVPVEHLYMELLAPAARYLGELWEEDLCNFTDVTVGLGRLQRVLRELSPALGGIVEHPAQGRRVLLLPSPGEQHTFGLVMVAEFFRRAGWDVTGGAWVESADAAALVAAEWFDVVGFSLGAEVHLPAMARSISTVRHAACNPQLAVLVGGPLFAVRPEVMEQVGADGMTIDGREAPRLAEGLITQRMALSRGFG